MLAGGTPAWVLVGDQIPATIPVNRRVSRDFWRKKRTEKGKYGKEEERTRAQAVGGPPPLLDQLPPIFADFC